ncbi:hypothetical protein D3C79_1074110 [compost metagenome]
MADIPRDKVTLEVVVHRELADVFISVGGNAANRTIILNWTTGLEVGTRGDGLKGEVRLGIA